MRTGFLVVLGMGMCEGYYEIYYENFIVVISGELSESRITQITQISRIMVCLRQCVSESATEDAIECATEDAIECATEDAIGYATGYATDSAVKVHRSDTAFIVFKDWRDIILQIDIL